ncbi:MAG TPA: phytanoyl-CoA dioxygenase family protein [Melioribacteraceae bacterium]|nr:phytanoyl-CoA dioxygenase family protein [Melioribacteraceae bacterium]
MYLDLLNNNYKLTSDQIADYKNNSFIKLKNVLPAEVILYYNQVISDKVNELNKVDLPLDKRDTYGKAFLQLFNLWKEDERIKELVFSRRLAKIASELMEVSGVRLYHDQALFKEAGGGITPWHADQYYWPLSSDKTITAWIPLQAVPLNMGPLEFSSGSNKLVYGRELAISDESEKQLKDKLRVNDFPHVIEPYDIGEVSFHSGWIFHRAGANTSGQIRKVMTVIYMDKDMILKKPENDNQKLDWETWCPGAKVGEVIDTPLNSVLYSE